MAITRACTYPVIIKTPENPNNYEKIRVSFSQNQERLFTIDKGRLNISSDSVSFTLTQEETKMFSPSKKSPMGARVGSPAYMQIRTYKSPSEAPGSECWQIEVFDSLNDEVLPYV